MEEKDGKKKSGWKSLFINDENAQSNEQPVKTPVKEQSKRTFPSQSSAMVSSPSNTSNSVDVFATHKS